MNCCMVYMHKFILLTRLFKCISCILSYGNKILHFLLYFWILLQNSQSCLNKECMIQVKIGEAVNEQFQDQIMVEKYKKMYITFAQLFQLCQCRSILIFFMKNCLAVQLQCFPVFCKH